MLFGSQEWFDVLLQLADAPLAKKSLCRINYRLMRRILGVIGRCALVWTFVNVPLPKRAARLVKRVVEVGERYAVSVDEWVWPF